MIIISETSEPNGIVLVDSETNWERIDQMADEEIDTSDIPPLDDAFFANAELRLPKGKVPVVMSVDADVF